MCWRCAKQSAYILNHVVIHICLFQTLRAGSNMTPFYDSSWYFISFWHLDVWIFKKRCFHYESGVLFSCYHSTACKFKVYSNILKVKYEKDGYAECGSIDISWLDWSPGDDFLVFLDLYLPAQLSKLPVFVRWHPRPIAEWRCLLLESTKRPRHTLLCSFFFFFFGCLEAIDPTRAHKLT